MKKSVKPPAKTRVVDLASLSKVHHCTSAAATRRLGVALGKALPLGSVVALVGELGAGKTTFVQGLAAGVGVLEREQVLSPTYTLVNEYPAKRGWLIHLDLYRLEVASKAAALGLEDSIGRSDAITAVEWADRLPELFEARTIWVTLSNARGGRRIEIGGAPIRRA